jgi:hypothetical protein
MFCAAPVNGSAGGKKDRQKTMRLVRCVMKIDGTVKKETKYIALWTAILSLLLQAVFLVMDAWGIDVLLGNLFGGCIAVLNFFLLGLTVQNAVKKSEEDAKKTMKISHTYRNLLVLAAAALAIVLPCFHTWAAIIPMFFPRIAIALRPLMDRAKKETE